MFEKPVHDVSGMGPDFNGTTNRILNPSTQAKLNALNGEMSSFDQRCNQTKAMVASLAQRLNEAKRDTSWELNRLQKSKSTSPMRDASDTGNRAVSKSS